MREDGDSQVPSSPEPFIEPEVSLLNKLFTNSQLLQRFEEGATLLPDTFEGAEAVFNIQASNR